MLSIMEQKNLNLTDKRLNIANLAVMLTYQCQMACRYCFLDRRYPDMSEDILKRSIDLLFTSPSKEVELQFFGGEPLLRFDLIKKAIGYAENKSKQINKNVKYLITTNGLLLDEEKLGFLKRHNVTIMLSLDGSKNTQIKNRPLIKKSQPDYFNRLIKNLKKLLDKKVPYFINLTFLPEDLPDLKANLDYLISLGVKDIQLSYAIGGDFKEEDLPAYIGALKEIIKIAQEKKVRLRNIYNDIEPVFASPQINIAACGDIYLGCAFIIEKAFEDSNKLFYFGRIQDVKDISILKRTREEQLAFLMSKMDKLHPRLTNNLYFGVGLYAFLKNYALVEKYASFTPQTIERQVKPRMSLTGFTEQTPNTQSFNYLYTDKMMLMLTYQCQMACRYCFLDRRYPDMSEDILKRSIDLLFTSPSKEVELQFFGGEPLLRFDLIKKAIGYAENKSKQINKNVKYLITTNGLLLDEEKLVYLKRYNVYFLLSIDGQMFTQSINRPLLRRKQRYPFDTILKALRLLSRKQFDFFVNMVIGPPNINTLIQDALFLFKEGVKKIRFSYELGPTWKDEEISNYFISLFKITQAVRKRTDVEIINKGADDEPYLISPALTVDYDGKIYCGCTIPLEKLFLRLRKVNLVGDVKINKSMQDLNRSKNNEITAVLKAYLANSSSRGTILSNLVLGELSDNFFNGLLNEGKQDRFLDYDMYKTVNSLMVMCTYVCQLECNYCEVKRLNLSMSKEVLHKTIELLLSTRSDECLLRFWGGEPLLRWDFIKEGIELGEKKAREKAKAIKFMITTNGLLLDREKLDYLKRHPVEIMFSLDGDSQTNQVHRFLKCSEKTYAQALNALRLLMDSGLPYFVNMVVSPLTVNKLCANLNFLKSLKVKRVQLCYRNGILWPKAKATKLINELKEFILKDNDTSFLMNFTSDCEPTMLSQEILVDTDGKVYSDAAIFMEKKFPALRNSYFRGRADEIKNIDSLYRTRRELYYIFRDSCSKKEKGIFLNNINLGLKLDSFFDSFHQRSLDSNEHPLLVPIIKGDFYAQIKLLKKIEIDALFLYLQGPCLNDCLFCKHKEEGFSDLFGVEMKLKDNLKIKAKKLCIIGNDPLLHPEINRVVDLSRQYGFREIEIMTSGERLSDAAFCKELIQRGVSSFSLPLFAVKDNIHDYIVGRQGSFLQVTKGIRNILIYKAKVFVHTNLIKQNLDYIKNLEGFVRKELRVPFVILPIRPKTANISFVQVMPSYAETIKKLKGVDSLLGFPLCVVRRIQETLFKDRQDISDSMKLYVLDQRFYKPRVCAECFYFNRCPGLFKEYLYLYPLREIRPHGYIDGQKDKIRERMRQKINSLRPGLKKRLDSQIFKNVLKLLEFKKAKRIGIFLYERSVNTNLLIAKSFELKKLLYASFYHKEKATVFYSIDSIEDLDFTHKKPKLKKFRELKDIKKLDLVFISCLAFNDKGVLIGNGFGDRDRFLERCPFLRQKEITLAYSFQRIKDFPKHKFDVPTPMVITEKGIYKIRND